MLSRMNGSKQVAIVSSISLIAFLVGACGILPSEGTDNATATSAPTLMPIPPTLTQSPTPEFVSIPATVMPTPQPPPLLTAHAIQVERWEEYQTELAKVLFAFDPEQEYHPEAYKDSLCEWDILGQSGQEVYVWAACNSSNGLVLKSNPAVIYLELDGSIREVNVVRAKTDPCTQFAVYDLQLFPMSVQEKLCLYYFFGTVPQCGSIVIDYIPGIGLSSREGILISPLEYRRKGHAEQPP